MPLTGMSGAVAINPFQTATLSQHQPLNIDAKKTVSEAENAVKPDDELSVIGGG